MLKIKLSNELASILEMVCSGLTNKQIATKLNYTTRNVEYKITKLFKLYKVENRLQLTKEYVKQALTDF